MVVEQELDQSLFLVQLQMLSTWELGLLLLYRFNLDNTIGSINVLGSAAGVSVLFNGIWNNTGATALVINNNTVGSTTTANSINSSSAATGTTAAVVQGIVNSGAATAISITNNTIANLNSAYVPAVAKNANIVCGISSTSGTNTITGECSI